jgi:subtilisin family serine protease
MTRTPRSAALWLAIALAAMIVAGSVQADQRVIVLLKRSKAAAIDRNAPRVHAKWRVVPGFAATVDDAELERLRNDPDVISVEPDLAGTVSAVSSAAAIDLNGELIGLNGVQALGYDGAGSTVAVLDTGVSPHPDLKGRVIEERCYCARANGKGCCPNGATVQSGSGSARDDRGHGTSVAGVIAGDGGIAPRGVAPGANIIAIRVADETGYIAWTSQVISALDSLLASPVRVDAVNMSFAIGDLTNGACDKYNVALADALARVHDRGIVLVAASGNDAATHGIRPPACVSSVISVGAVYHMHLGFASLLGCSDSPAEVDRVTCFSNSSASLDLLAPGYGVNAPASNGGIISSAGTSFSSPHVAGAVAVLRQIDRDLTPEEIEQLLEVTGRPIVDSRNGITTPRLDLFAAVMKLRLDLKPAVRRRTVQH